MDILGPDDGSAANEAHRTIKALADKHVNRPSSRDRVGVRRVMRDDDHARVAAEHFEKTVRASAACTRHGFGLRAATDNPGQEGCRVSQTVGDAGDQNPASRRASRDPLIIRRTRGVATAF